jgi:putative nucleotidyltransferase-like protein
MRAADTEYVHRVRPALLALMRAAPDDAAACAATIEKVHAGGDQRGWDRFVALASRHGLLGIVNAQMTRMPQLSDALRQTALHRIALEELWYEHVERGLRRAISVVTDAGVEVCALKGPVLARRLYSPPAVRYSVDVDLLVRPDDLAAALEAFAAAGYVAESGATAEYLLKYSHHVELSRPGEPPIELHFRAYAGFGSELSADVLLARAQRFDLGDGLSVLVPPPEEEFVYLAAHAAGHSFIRLVWLYDLKLFCSKYHGTDWRRVADLAERHSVKSAVAYTLRVLERWLNVAPMSLPGELRRAGAAVRVADWLLTEVSTPQPKSPRDNLGGLLFTSLLCDTGRAGLWLWQHHLGRILRRRLYRLAPMQLPERWSA